MTPYCTDQDVIDCCAWPAWAQQPDTARSRLINTATSKVDRFCRRGFVDATGAEIQGFPQQSVTETFDGHGQSKLWLSLRPVITVTSVTINGDALDNSNNDAWTLTPGNGRLVRGDGHQDSRFDDRWLSSSSGIVVQYWGGYLTLPDQVVTATAYLVRYLYERGKVSGIFDSESIGDYSYKLAQIATNMTVPQHVADLLADFVQDDAY